MSKDIASYFLEQGEPIVPKRKPIYTNYLKTLDTQAAKNTISPQTINMLKSEFTDKAYQNKELSATDYYEAIKPVSTEPKLVDGRIEFGNGGTKKKPIDIQASGSISGDQQIYGAPAGITSNKQVVNAILKLDIPISEKINLIGDYQYGKFRDKIKYNDKEIYLEDPGSYKNRKIGLSYNEGGEGFSGYGKYNVDTGEKEGGIKFIKKFNEGGRVNFASGTDYWAMVTRMFIEAGSEKGTGMNIKDFAAQYFPRDEKAEGGRIGFQEGKLAQLGNIADVRNIPYYASKTVEGAVNAGEVLSKLPFAVGDLASKLLREKPSKEMFLSSLKNIQPGTWSDAIGLSELVTRQEEDLSPEVKTMGSQLSLTSETFIPVGTAIKLGDKIIKNASKQLGKVDNNKTLEQVIDKRLSDYGESRRDFNKIVASTGMMAGLKALGLSSIKTAGQKVDDIKIKLRVSDDAEFTDGSWSDASGYFVQFEPLTKKGKQILEAYSKNGKIPEDYLFDNAEDAAMMVEKISPNVRSHVDIEIAQPKKATDDIVVKEEKIGSGKDAYIAREYSKIYRPGDTPPTPDDLISYGSNLVEDFYPYASKSNFRNEFHEDIINQIIKPKKTLDDVIVDAKTGIEKFRTKVKQGIDTLEESKKFGFPDD